MLDLHVKVERTFGTVVLSTLWVGASVFLRDLVVSPAEVSFPSTDVPPVKAKIRLVFIGILLVAARLAHFLRERLSITAHL